MQCNVYLCVKNQDYSAVVCYNTGEHRQKYFSFICALFLVTEFGNIFTIVNAFRNFTLSFVTTYGVMTHCLRSYTVGEESLGEVIETKELNII